MVDRIQPLKIEDSATGGVEVDPYPTATDRNEDYLDARGVAYQNATSNDDLVRTERDSSNNLVLRDPVAGPHTLASLLGGGGFDVDTVVLDAEGRVVYNNAELIVTKG